VSLKDFFGLVTELVGPSALPQYNIITQQIYPHDSPSSANLFAFARLFLAYHPESDLGLFPLAIL